MILAPVPGADRAHHYQRRSNVDVLFVIISHDINQKQTPVVFIGRTCRPSFLLLSRPWSTEVVVLQRQLSRH